METEKAALPEMIGQWKLAAPPQAIHAGNIFNYMNGAGELYLAYRFDGMLAYEYRDGSGNDIVAELYRMKGSDDAFGLLSLDWGGEAVTLSSRGEGTGAPEAQHGPVAAVVPAARALYGEGLLRLWSGDIYARIMAVRETPEAREAILKLGGMIVAGRGDPPPPTLLRLVPSMFAPHWQLKKERSAFFRSHLVLNSLYYLSHDNLLNLDASCAAVFGSYEGGDQRFHLLIVQYAGPEAAAAALKGFMQGYLPELEKGAREAAQAGKACFQVEDGWLGCRIQGSWLALAFACPDQRTARGVMDRLDFES